MHCSAQMVHVSLPPTRVKSWDFAYIKTTGLQVLPNPQKMLFVLHPIEYFTAVKSQRLNLNKLQLSLNLN